MSGFLTLFIFCSLFAFGASPGQSSLILLGCLLILPAIKSKETWLKLGIITWKSRRMKWYKVDIHEHRLNFDEQEHTLETTMITKEPSLSRGLELDQAAERLVRDGQNVLTPPKKKSTLRKANFQNTYLGGNLIAVAFLNAFIEFYQLQKVDAILASCLAMIPEAEVGDLT
ncbi:hypothetical protein JB92DRAFT_3129222 [Gautieria morchelliformis]|nr:hypothetical protein JB92DRAFT_3129222 [Gautieria morchelliformis]